MLDVLLNLAGLVAIYGTYRVLAWRLPIVGETSRIWEDERKKEVKAWEDVSVFFKKGLRNVLNCVFSMALVLVPPAIWLALVMGIIKFFDGSWQPSIALNVTTVVIFAELNASVLILVVVDFFPSILTRMTIRR
ncbi:MAG: hypothetical protein Q7S09_03115 [bacterium]|nr:hypothetical protein [bacterium]